MTPPRQPEEAVRRFIERNDLISPGDTIVVGVSGGVDSVCLLHLLADLRVCLGMSIHVAHLDHRLRGAESEEDARHVRRLAENLRVPATIDSRDVQSFRAGRRLSLEEAARQVRYRFLAEVAREAGAAAVAVGHTSSDQMETILMHLVRGTGTAGLVGMQPSSLWVSKGLRGLRIIRPLLVLTREETESYCRRMRLTPREDSSNLSLSLFRNRVRRELVPLLEGYNPRIREGLLRMSDTLAVDLAFLEDCVTEAWEKVASVEPGAILLDRKAAAALHPAVQRHMMRRVAREVLGDLEDIESKHVDRMREALTLRKGKRVALPRLTLAVEGRLVKVTPAVPGQSG